MTFVSNPDIHFAHTMTKASVYACYTVCNEIPAVKIGRPSCCRYSSIRSKVIGNGSFVGII
jgi:hypothetical protein